jgi:hypothetical protein
MLFFGTLHLNNLHAWQTMLLPAASVKAAYLLDTTAYLLQPPIQLHCFHSHNYAPSYNYITFILSISCPAAGCQACAALLFSATSSCI